MSMPLKAAMAALLLLVLGCHPQAQHDKPDAGTTVHPVVRPCFASDGGALPTGVWEEVTPPAVNLTIGNGTLSVVLDPLDPANVFLGSDKQGLYKSTDCGASWAKINTGRNGDTLDSGSLWSFVIDPVDSKVMYISPLYGSDVSLFKSTNGGVDWDSVMPKGSNVAQAVQYTFFQALSIDPTNHQHLVATFHIDCNPPNNKLCMAESTDAGASWRLFNGPVIIGNGGVVQGWTEDAGPIAIDATTMLWGAWGAPLYYSSDSGMSWQRVAGSGHWHMYTSPSGWSYMGTGSSIQRSRDLIHWTAIDKTPSLVGGGLAGDGKTVWAGSRQYVMDVALQESDGASLSSFAAPSISQGANWLVYDSVHKLLYSNNTKGGLWRIGVE
jgi:hypothetical protein